MAVGTQANGDALPSRGVREVENELVVGGRGGAGRPRISLGELEVGALARQTQHHAVMSTMFGEAPDLWESQRISGEVHNLVEPVCRPRDPNGRDREFWWPGLDVQDGTPGTCAQVRLFADADRGVRPLPSETPVATLGSPRSFDERTEMNARRLLATGTFLLGVMSVLPAAQGAPAPGSWRVLPAAPIDVSEVQTGVWTGHEALFTYKSMTTRQAAAYDPAKGTWRVLPGGSAPTTGSEGGAASVWTGTDWLVWGLRPGKLLVYRPATNRWRVVGGGDVGMPSDVVVWTGKRMIGWGGGCCAEFNNDGGSYAPATNSWRRLPKPPVVGRQASAGAWTGREMIVAGGFTERQGSDGVTRAVILRDAAAYNPTSNAWRTLPPLPAGRRDMTAVWTGRDLLVVGGSGAAGRLLVGVFAYRPSTNRWRMLAPLPRGRSSHSAVWTGKQLIVWGGSITRDGELITPNTGLVYTPANNRWTPIAPAPIPGRNNTTALWTGSGMLVAGGGYPTAGEAALFTPGG